MATKQHPEKQMHLLLDLKHFQGTSPAIILSKVDLPQPEGPTMVKNSPAAMSRFTSDGLNFIKVFSDS